MRPARLLLVAGLVATLAAGCSVSPKAQLGPEVVSGKRLIVMAQGAPQANRVVENHALGLLKAQGVKVEFRFNASTPNIALTQVLTGDVDVYSASMSDGLTALNAGIPLVGFALAQPRQDYVFLSGSGIKTLADLKGKTIGVQDTTGATYVQALLILRKAGLTVKDVNIVVTGGQSVRLAALIAKRIDATMLSHASQITLAAGGYNTLYDYTKESPDLWGDQMWTTKAWLTKNTALAVAVNKALLDSFVWFNDGANADAVVTEGLTIDSATGKGTMVALFRTLRDQGAYPAGTILDRAQADAQQTLYIAAGLSKAAIPVAQWVDPSYAKTALASIKK
jgi:NitT/TauT family transport system substrate-binding protein